MRFSQTGLPWINPSPNIPGPDAALLYTGTCLFEGTNISEGRGTTKPFEMIGAPWLDPYELAERMNGEGLAGVAFRPVEFIPQSSKFQGEICAGVQAQILDSELLKPLETGLKLLYAVQEQSGSRFEFIRSPQIGPSYFLDYLCGTDAVRKQKQSADELLARWAEQATAYKQAVKVYELY